jgi:hypothetical protein
MRIINKWVVFKTEGVPDRQNRNRRWDLSLSLNILAAEIISIKFHHIF